MDGFLSNNWRDGLNVIGVALTILQSLSLFRGWLSRRRTGKKISLRFGYLEEADFSESSPEDKRVIRIAFAISCGVVVACLIASGLAKGGEGCFAEMLQIWPPMLIGLIAIFHEASGLAILNRYFLSKVDKEDRGRVGLMVSISLIVLFIMSYLMVSSPENWSASWFTRLVFYYAGAYLFVFAIVTLSEVLYQVDEWKESRKKQQQKRPRLR